MSSTNFQNLFQTYATSTVYQTALDKSLKIDENPSLYNGAVGAGGWEYPSHNANPWTIGYGYDFSTKTGSQIEKDFKAAGITLPQNVLTALNAYTEAKDVSELNNVSTAMQGFSLTDAEATSLLNVAVPAAQASVTKEVTSWNTEYAYPVINSSVSLAYNTNNELNALFVNEDYNGGSLFGNEQMSNVATDDLSTFLVDFLFYNNLANKVYSQGVENRRVHDSVNSLGSGPIN